MDFILNTVAFNCNLVEKYFRKMRKITVANVLKLTEGRRTKVVEGSI